MKMPQVNKMRTYLNASEDSDLHESCRERTQRIYQLSLIFVNFVSAVEPARRGAANALLGLYHFILQCPHVITMTGVWSSHFAQVSSALITSWIPDC